MIEPEIVKDEELEYLIKDVYDLYGYVPSMYLNLYDVRGRLLDYIFDSMSQKDQEIIMNFINNLKEFV